VFSNLFLAQSDSVFDVSGLWGAKIGFKVMAVLTILIGVAPHFILDVVSVNSWRWIL
jgi:hypothetical protein